jgi:hypothetical protein
MAADSSVIRQAGNHRTDAFRVLVLASMLLASQALVGPGTRPAMAHTHPSNVELGAPAVVRVETRVRVDIWLIEHNRHGKHIGLIHKTYEPLAQAGSGFAVDPSGVIVAAGGVVQVDDKQARNYAVNHIFHDRYGGRAPLPKVETATHTIRNLPDDPLNGRLQRCYQANTADATGGCVVTTTRQVKVYPFVENQARNGNLTAEVLYPKAGRAADVAVLKVGASSMPTVNLGDSAANVPAFTAMGFTKIPTGPGPIVTEIGHLTQPDIQIKQDKFAPKLSKVVALGVWGGPVVAEQGGRTIGFLQVRPNKAGGLDPYLTDAKAIRAALAAAKVVEPHRGPTDAVFEAAMHNYKNKQYELAIPNLARTLELYQGHAVATQSLAIANQRKGTAQDESFQQEGGPIGDGDNRGGGLPIGLLAAVAAVVAVLGLLLFGVAYRRRADGAAAPGQPAQPGPSAPPAQPPSARSRSEPRTTPRERMGLSSLWSSQPSTEPPRAPVPMIEQPPDLEPQETPSFCTACGRRLAPEHRFCGFCGQKVR